MKITFYPDNKILPLNRATLEYQAIWDGAGNRIEKVFKEITGLKFKEEEITGVVFEGISYSNPLCLRASYPYETKKATLIHELGHRLLMGNGINGKDALVIHKQLFLVLYDVWIALYGEAFAKREVIIEKKRSPLYAEAWDWALGFHAEARTELFKELKKGSKSSSLPLSSQKVA